MLKPTGPQQQPSAQAAMSVTCSRANPHSALQYVILRHRFGKNTEEENKTLFFPQVKEMNEMNRELNS